MAMAMMQEDNHHAGPSKRQERRSQEVWAHNLEEEIYRMRDVAETYQHIALDTQFPGIIARPNGPFSDYSDYNYQTLKCNLNLTRVIQIGMTFSDGKGNRPKGISTWRFNFHFDLQRDLYLQDSIEILRQTRNLDLVKHSTQGIQGRHFGELLMSTGLVLNEDVRWITFCGPNGFAERPRREEREPPWVTFCSMYDLGQLLQLLTSQALPDEVKAFNASLDMFFPCRCDVAKHLHRLPQLNAEVNDSKKRSLFRNAHHILEAFFRLPDSVRRTAFDPEEEVEEEEEPPAVRAEKSQRNHRRSRDRDERKADAANKREPTRAQAKAKDVKGSG